MDMGLKGFIFPQFGTNNLLLSTETLLWSLRDNGGSVTKNWDTSAIGMGKPSTPLFVPGTNAVLVGSDNGRLYQLNATTGSVAGFVQLGDGLSGVGAPSFDVANGMILVGSEAGSSMGSPFRFPNAKLKRILETEVQAPGRLARLRVHDGGTVQGG